MGKLADAPSFPQGLEALEASIDVDHVQAVEKRQWAALNFESVDRRPTIITVCDEWRNIQHDHVSDWPVISVVEAFADPAKRLIREMERVVAGTLLRDDRVNTIRVTYGGVAAASLFGGRYEFAPGRMPHLIPLEGREAVVRMLERGVPDLGVGLFSRVWETLDLWQSWLESFPRLQAVTRIGAPDLIDPSALVKLVTGRDLLAWIGDDAALAHDILRLMTETVIAIVRAYADVVGQSPDHGYLFSHRLRGGGVFYDRGQMGDRSGASIDLYGQFIRPCVVHMGESLGGVAVRVNGHGIELFGEIVATPGVTAVSLADLGPENFAQRHEQASLHKVVLLWDGEILPDDEHLTTGVIHKRIIPDWEDARAVARVLYGRVR